MKIDKERYEKAIGKAKKLIYPKRTNWKKYNLANYDFEFKGVGNIDYYQNGPFNYNYPSVLKLQWHCLTPYELLKRFAQQQCQVGDDNDGKSVYLRFKYFMHYCATDAIEEDSPLYLFDEHFRHSRSKTTTFNGSTPVECIDDITSNLSNDCGMQPLGALESEYTVPDLFKYDFLDLVNEDRPPHRWFVVGPTRSGTTLHVDPLGTSAWNMLMYGRKRWVLFPPETPIDLIKPYYVDQASRWFSEIYPKLKYVYKVEFVQYPSECVYIPAGWYHIVINLDFSIAITHNFCTLQQFELCYRHCKWSRPKLALKLKNNIKSNSPQVQQLCDYYNTTVYDLTMSMSIIDHIPQHELSSDPSDSD